MDLEVEERNIIDIRPPHLDPNNIDELIGQKNKIIE